MRFARQTSLRVRFIVGLGAVLMPFFLAAAAGLFYLLPALIDPLEEVVKEVTDELEPVRNLQVTLLATAVAAHRLSAGEPAPDDRQLARLSQRVEQAFEKARAVPFHDPRERALIESAWTEWRLARQLVEPSLLRNPAGSAGDGLQSGLFDARVERSAALLGEVYEVARRKIEKSRTTARAARSRSLWVTFAAFALALAISFYAGIALARSVVTGVEAIRRSAARLAGGELSHRAPSAREDEFGDLAAAFNAMAEELQKDREVIRELAIRDGLTGLLNRRAFLEDLREELVRSRRYGHGCALLLLDVDRFKIVNDTWGHPAGDEVLRAVAARIRQSVRPMDKVARYGGEEFAVLLPETGTEGATALAERIRAGIAAVPVVVAGGRAINVTVSAGLAAFVEDAQAEDALIAAADAALYAAKEGGRNRVSSARSIPR